MSVEGIQNQYRQLGGSYGTSVPTPAMPAQPTFTSASTFQEFYKAGIPTAVQGPFRESSMWESWFTSAAKQTFRNFTGRGIDYALQKTKYGEIGQELIPQQAQRLGNWPTNVGKNALSYREFFNLGKSAETLRAERLTNPKAFEYHTTPWRQVFREGKYLESVRNNFKDFGKASEALGGKTWTQYLRSNPLEFIKRTVVYGNLRPISTMLREGKNIGHGLASSLGLGLMFWDILSGTKDAYIAAKAQEDGSWGGTMNTLFQTGKTFAFKSFKNITAWEIGTIGFTLGTSLAAMACPGFIIPVLVGILTDALFSTITKRTLSLVMPDPPKAA